MLQLSCNKCKRKYNFLSVVKIQFEDSSYGHLCPQCASKFIESLANWKDFMVIEEFEHFCKL